MGQIRYWAFLMGVLLLCAGAMAAEGPRIAVTSAEEWLVAGSGAGTAVTATVTDAGGSPLPGMNVTFSCGAAMGLFSPVTATTGPDGTATATFVPGTGSGTALITATVESGGAEVSGTCEQKIDHAPPYRLQSLDYESRVSVDTTTGIVFSLEDEYGNLVDARRIAETFRFGVGSPDGSAGIFDGTAYCDDVVLPVGADGTVRAELRVARTAGENVVFVDLPEPVADLYLTFYGIGDGAPSSITASVNPGGTPPYLPADGESRFTITYTMKDQYGNPAGNRSVRVTSDVGTETVATSNSAGLAQVTFGPRDVTGLVTITAVSVDDPAVSCTVVVEFVHTDPVDMLLTANPQTMPSYDVNAGSVAEVRAKVIDVKGNPVPNETVTFSLGTVNTGSYGVTDAPALLGDVATTDENGYATILFRPGGFTTDRDDPAYSSAASGTGVVSATWGSVTREIELRWVNFPYLSVSAWVEPESGQVAVNETIDVNLALKGDGWALQPEPIDVVLVIDRSGSMRGEDSSGEVRLVSAKNAASTFIDAMDPRRDRVGLVSFSSTTTIDRGLTDDFSGVKTQLDALRADGSTQLRRGIYEAIRLLQEQGRDDAVKAVIVMTDGDWNTDADPLGRGIGLPDGVGRWSGSTILYDYYEYYDGLGGTLDYGWVSVPYAKWWGGGYYYQDERQWHCHDGEETNQNMGRFALDNGIKLYPITFAYSPGPEVTNTMETLASLTGGFYAHAPGGDELAGIYKRIAGELKTEAGVDTTIDLSFENVEVNGAAVPGDDVFEYIYEDGISTVIESWVENESGRYVVVPWHTEDQTADWQDDQSLHYDVGTVRLGQTWTTSYRLRVKTDGNINVFGPGSTISFNGGADQLTLPDTFISVRPEGTEPVFGNVILDLSDLHQVGTGPVTEFLKLGWDLDYNGTETVDQKIWYSTDENRHTQTLFMQMPPRSAAEVGAQTAEIDVRSIPAGQYYVWVHATAPDAGDDEIPYDGEITIGTGDSTKIRLE
ncbi:VWA domain-containing protein [Methanofollis formosanus]|uniref:VWA domain-containing protein n=1 Tax=Methanofollis formosanus TaxID=299308 RepID=A0A8G1A2A3_9EURY|nr:Ig-like domain-containing protein [Methanofollis formosanus]QYZ79113.1 VWA domain-containing protein [Methanofollis formosanus]